MPDAFFMGHVILIFIDGLGLGENDQAKNPLARPVCSFYNDLFLKFGKPTDVSLGLPGLPQSATGQTALLTGLNAAQAIGGHLEGFPNEALRSMIVENNIFTQLQKRRLTATFANAYQRETLAEIQFKSVTTVATFSAFGQVRTLAHLQKGEAVYQDITNRYLVEQGHPVPLVTPETAGRNLLAISRDHHFTLFEYFQTDRAGHAMDMERALAVLDELQRFLQTVVREFKADDTLLVMTSDHGNIEDLSIKTHTRHKVPTVAMGYRHREFLDHIETIVDVCPAMLRFFDENGPEPQEKAGPCSG